MVRQYRKMGNHIPDGQPRTSQDGENMVKELVRLRAVAEAAEAIRFGTFLLDPEPYARAMNRLNEKLDALAKMKVERSV